MYYVLLISLIVISVHSSTTNNTSLLSQTQQPKLSLLQSCSQNQSRMAVIAINSCDQTNISNTVDCIAKYISTNYSKLRWNVFAKNTKSNPNSVAFWYFYGCYIQLQNWGKYNRTFLLWPHMNYTITKNTTDQSQYKKTYLIQQLSKTLKNHFKYELIQPYTQINQKTVQFNTQIDKKLFLKKASLQIQQSLLQQNNTCQQWKTSSVKSSMTLCDIVGNKNAAQCIKNRIKDQITGHWNVYVGDWVNSTLSYWNTISLKCQVLQHSFGTYNRNIFAWKAYGISEV